MAESRSSPGNKIYLQPGTADYNSHFPIQQNQFSNNDKLLENNFNYPIGMNVDFVIGQSSLQFYHIDYCLEKLIHCPTNQINNRTFYYFFDRFSADEHKIAINDLFPRAILLLEKYWPENPVVNLVFNIKCQLSQSKRILIQLKNRNRDLPDEENLLYGKIVDITEFVADGMPKLMLIINNCLKETISSKELALVNNCIFGLNKKDLQLLELKSQGKRTKEISEIMKTSELSIYASIRDIKRKSEMDTIPLIQLLIEKGYIQAYYK